MCYHFVFTLLFGAGDEYRSYDRADDGDIVKDITCVESLKKIHVESLKHKSNVKRERKPNEVKRQVIDWVRVMLEGFALNGKLDTVSVSNPERTVDFTVGGKSYTLTLTEHRAPKPKA